MTGSEAIAILRGHEKYETLASPLAKDFIALREKEFQEFIDNNSQLFGDIPLSINALLWASVAFDVHRKQKVENAQIRQDMKRGIINKIEKVAHELEKVVHELEKEKTK